MERAVRTSGFGLDKGFTVCCKGPWRRGGQFSSVMGKHVVSAESSTLFYIRVPSGTLPHHDMAAIPAPCARVECMVPAAQADTARAADGEPCCPRGRPGLPLCRERWPALAWGKVAGNAFRVCRPQGAAGALRCRVTTHLFCCMRLRRWTSQARSLAVLRPIKAVLGRQQTLGNH